MKTRDFGFTLIELLVGILIASLLMLGVASVFTTTASDSVYLNNTANLTKEAQIAQQLITGHLSEAIYVIPSGYTTNIRLGGTGDTLKNTVDGNNNWQWLYGNKGTAEYSPNISATPLVPYTQNFVAMILPPLAPPTFDSTGKSTNCTGQGTGTTPGITDGCYRFYAYFPMRRSALVNSSLAQSNRPRADILNDFPNNATQDRWVIMEYRANLYDTTTNNMWKPSYTNPTGGLSSADLSFINTNATLYQSRAANLLVDYIKPRSLSFTVYRPNTGKANGHVDFTFAMQQLTSGGSNPKSIVVKGTSKNPVDSSTDNLGSSVIVKNWFCAADIVTTVNKPNCP